jgi:hypothetical protein
MRRRRRTIHLRASHEVSRYNAHTKKILAGVVGIFIFFVVIVAYVATRWADRGNLVLVAPDISGAVNVYTLRPGSLTLLTIPKDVVMVTGRGLGEWPAESIWKLGHDERVGGSLLASTITRSFSIPVTAWGSEAANGIVGTLAQKLSFVLSPFETNLSLAHKLQIVWQVSQLSQADIVKRDAKQIGLVTVDQNGVAKPKSGTESILASIFATTNMPKGIVTVGVVDATGGGTRAVPLLSQVLSVLGMKVVSVEKQPEQEFGCEVMGEKATTQLVSRVFGCRFAGTETKGFDVIVTVGKAFEQQY